MLLTTVRDWILFIVLIGEDVRFDFSRDDQNTTAPVILPLSIRRFKFRVKIRELCISIRKVNLFKGV
jgi:hypothetical protein